MISEAPPSYDDLDETVVPTYSLMPGSTERLLKYEPLRATGCQTCDWMFATSHMSINLGARVWGLHAPSYGLNGTIEGSITALGDRDHIERVTATLEGTVSGNVYEGRLATGGNKLNLISKTCTLYSSALGTTFPPDSAFTFSLPIPAETRGKDGMIKLPPSFRARYEDLGCTVSYVLKIEMLRKSMLWKRETKSIPILYLPKSRPPEPPLHAIPRPSSNPFPVYVRVKTIDLSTTWPGATKSAMSHASSVYLSLPSPLCYTAGECVPLTLGLACPESQALTDLMSRNFRIVIIKRMRVWSSHGQGSVEDTVLTTTRFKYFSEYTGGVTLLRGSIQAGLASRENSWCVPGVAEVQYLLRITLRPSENAAERLPSFMHEEPIQITTDCWGTMERELASTGGTPTPALGLAYH